MCYYCCELFLGGFCRTATSCFLRDVCCVDVGCLLVFSILLLLLLLPLSIGVILSDIYLQNNCQLDNLCS